MAKCKICGSISTNNQEICSCCNIISSKKDVYCLIQNNGKILIFSENEFTFELENFIVKKMTSEEFEQTLKQK